MADLLVALALLTFAGVVGLVAMVIALYVASAALEAAHRAKKKDNNCLLYTSDAADDV